MSEYLIQQSTMTGIADAIRAKAGITGTMTPAKMVEAINSIKTKIPCGNGKEWTNSNITSSAWSVLAYGNGIWVAGSYTTSSVGIRWSTNGMTWTESNVTSGGIQKIAYGDGLFVAAGDSDAGGLLYSEDGNTWTQSNVTSTSFDIAFHDGMWCATVVDSGIYYSTDGMTWTQSNVTSNRPHFLLYSNGVWVVAGNSIASRDLMYSTDGMTWNSCDKSGSNITGNLNTLWYANGLWIVGGRSDVGLAYSTDGITWKDTNKTSGTFYGAITYSNGLWVVGEYDDGGLYYSTDGMTWTQSNITSNSFFCVDCANGVWVACSDNGLYYSTDGMTWTKSNVVTSSVTVPSALNANGMWVAAYTGLKYSASFVSD
jgi:hypothetical protein